MWFPAGRLALFGVVALLLTAAAGAQQAEPEKTATSPPTYILGPEDQISIRALDADEISDRPIRIGSSGDISLPLVGRVRAAGLTVEQLEAELASRLKVYLQSPHVSVNVIEFRNQPVSVIGSVSSPGVHQLLGHKTLVEVISMAGGLRADAGNSVKITRRLEWGRIPLPDARDDSTGKFSTADVSLKDILEARNPGENIEIRPNDVISVPRAEMVYVIGDVAKPGGFVLNERENITALQALSLAGGLGHTSDPRKAAVLRSVPGASRRTEVPLDVKAILASKTPDMPLQPDDILFIPSSGKKSVAFRSLETALGMGANIGTGIAIYRR